MILINIKCTNAGPSQTQTDVGTSGVSATSTLSAESIWQPEHAVGIEQEQLEVEHTEKHLQHVEAVEGQPKEQPSNTSFPSSASLPTNFSTDPAEWIIDDPTIDFLLSNEINQNLNYDFKGTKTFFPAINKSRCLTMSMFQRKMKNGKNIDRKYLCYSTSKKAIFCVPCRLFGDGTSKLGTVGFKDWSNAHKGLDSHERSAEHMKSCKDFLARSKIVGRVDTDLQTQIETKFNYWRNVLK